MNENNSLGKKVKNCFIKWWFIYKSVLQDGAKPQHSSPMINFGILLFNLHHLCDSYAFNAVVQIKM